MNILLTGATGFIGEYTLNKLLNCDCNVRVLSRKKIPENYKESKRIEWISCEYSVLKNSYLKNIDLILNLAAAGVSPKKAPFREMIDININFPLRLMLKASENNVRRFVTVGTCYEYGCKEINSLCKPNDTLDPLGMYAATKVSGFYSLKQLSKELNIEFCYGRIFNAYGKFVGNNTFWQLLYNAAISGSDFSMTYGNQIRDFITVESVAEILVNICLLPEKELNSPYIFNIGSGIAQKVKDFALNEWTRLQAEGKLIFGGISLRENEPKFLVADLSNLILGKLS